MYFIVDLRTYIHTCIYFIVDLRTFNNCHKSQQLCSCKNKSTCLFFFKVNNLNPVLTIYLPYILNTHKLPFPIHQSINQTIDRLRSNFCRFPGRWWSDQEDWNLCYRKILKYLILLTWYPENSEIGRRLYSSTKVSIWCCYKTNLLNQ